MLTVLHQMIFPITILGMEIIVIFCHQVFLDHKDEIISTSRKILPFYEKLYGTEFDENADIMLASELTQIGNGFATISPNLQTVMYPGGIFQFDRFATTDWLANLMYHEYSHLYQLNAKNSFPGRLGKYLFGNNFVNFLPMPLGFFPLVTIPLPIFSYPNVLTPDFLLEGHAVFNESRFGNGGRLYSGHYRALFYMMLNNSMVEEDRIINNHFYFPFNVDKYIFGGYFFNHLSFKHGIEKTAKFLKSSP